jgi:hypothetical protein
MYTTLHSVCRGLAVADRLILRVLSHVQRFLFFFTVLNWTERIRLAVTLCAAVWDMLGSNLGQGLEYPDWSSSWFCSAPQGILRVLHGLGHYFFLPDPFQFIFHPTI